MTSVLLDWEARRFVWHFSLWTSLLCKVQKKCCFYSARVYSKWLSALISCFLVSGGALSKVIISCSLTIRVRNSVCVLFYDLLRIHRKISFFDLRTLVRFDSSLYPPISRSRRTYQDTHSNSGEWGESYVKAWIEVVAFDSKNRGRFLQRLCIANGTALSGWNIPRWFPYLGK